MIINLTQHAATAEQRAAGVIDLDGAALIALRQALTFDTLPSAEEVRDRAERVADLATEFLRTQDYQAPVDAAMIGGALWLMAPLAAELRLSHISPMFAFSVRETEEQPQTDGSVRKVAVFRHKGFVPAVYCGE